MPDLNGITYTETLGSCQFSYEDGKAKATRFFDTAWDDRWQFLKALVGTFETFGGVLQRTAAATFPGFPALEAKRVSIRGIGTLDEDDLVEGAGFTKARFTVGYGIREWDETEPNEEGQVIRTETLDFSAEFLQMPEGGFKWGADASNNGTKIMQQLPKIFPLISHNFTRKGVTELPKAALTAALGRVNSGVFLDVPAGQLLFSGAHARREVTSEGARPYEVSYVFTERPQSWNLVWNTTDEDWRTTAPDLYDTSTFAGLLGV